MGIRLLAGTYTAGVRSCTVRTPGVRILLRERRMNPLDVRLAAGTGMSLREAERLMKTDDERYRVEVRDRKRKRHVATPHKPLRIAEE